MFAINIILNTVILVTILYVFMRLRTRTSSNVRSEVIIDTSGVIDGRLLAITEAGFPPGKLLIPNFVLNELQQLADNGDDIKRQRARDGMAAIQELQSRDDVEAEIIKTQISKDEPVDRRLVELAKHRSAKLYTVDYNLTQIARIEGVKVLNVNELAKAVRPLVLPGENIDIKLVQRGKEPKQAIGYLENGTMVVVDRAHNLIGQEITIEATHFIQTESGKILFAKKASHSKKKHSNRTKTTVKRK